MKKKIATLLLFVLATLVFYGGAGVNIVSYCCNHCQVAGVEAVLQDECCEIHEHNHQADGWNCADTHTSCCGMERLHFDWTSVQSLLSGLQPVAMDLHTFGQINASLLPVPQMKEQLSITSSGPPAGCPRMYLSLLTVLLI